MDNKTKGYLIVASRYYRYYKTAINLIDSILDYYPEAKITLVTEERFLDGREAVCDKVVFCDDHPRAKLWGMTQTPYDITMYIDADCEVQHEDIVHVFDELKDHDIVFTPMSKENTYCFNSQFFNDKAAREQDYFYTFQHSGAVVLYDFSKPLVRNFIEDWATQHFQHLQWKDWPQKDGVDDIETYPRELSRFDQFTLWLLLHKDPKYKHLDVGFFRDWARWNYFQCYLPSKTKPKDPIVIYHYSKAGM